MTHLTRSQREQLATLHRLGKTQTEIASFIHCVQSTVSKELRRNNSHHPRFWYDGEKAQMCAEQRRRVSKDKVAFIATCVIKEERENGMAQRKKGGRSRIADLEGGGIGVCGEKKEEKSSSEEEMFWHKGMVRKKKLEFNWNVKLLMGLFAQCYLEKIRYSRVSEHIHISIAIIINV